MRNVLCTVGSLSGVSLVFKRILFLAHLAYVIISMHGLRNFDFVVLAGMRWDVFVSLLIVPLVSVFLRKFRVGLWNFLFLLLRLVALDIVFYFPKNLFIDWD